MDDRTLEMALKPFIYLARATTRSSPDDSNTGEDRRKVLVGGVLGRASYTGK